MSKRVSLTDIIVNITAAVLALAAAVLLCVYLVRGAPRDTLSADVTETHVIGTEPVSGTTASEPETETSVTEETTETTTETEETAPLHAGEYDPAFFKNAFFVGDSISVGLVGYEFVKPENAFAQQGITTSSVATVKIDDVSVYEKISDFGPEYICVMLGTNGLAFLENDVMAEEMGTFVDGLKLRYPFAKIVIVSIPPVTQKREEENPQKLDIVIEYNELLRSLAEEKGVAYADSCSLLQDETGYLGDDYAERDGLHMKIHAYPVILGAIEDALIQYYDIDISRYIEDTEETGEASETTVTAEETQTAAQTSVQTGAEADGETSVVYDIVITGASGAGDDEGAVPAP